MHKLVFLGGTCGKNNWRDELIYNLKGMGVNTENLFNPVVADWTPECQAAEDKAKAEADCMLFYLDNPMTGEWGINPFRMIVLAQGVYEGSIHAICLDTGKEESNTHLAKVRKKIEADLHKAFPNLVIFENRSQLPCDLSDVFVLDTEDLMQDTSTYSMFEAMVAMYEKPHLAVVVVNDDLLRAKLENMFPSVQIMVGLEETINFFIENA